MGANEYRDQVAKAMDLVASGGAYRVEWDGSVTVWVPPKIQGPIKFTINGKEPQE